VDEMTGLGHKMPYLSSAEGHSSLAFCPGIDEIFKSFDLGEIHSPIEKRSPREFAWPCGPAAWKGGER
jgi:hypothetical protein